MPRLYCGNREPLPEGYDGYDSRYNCLRKGVGIGLYKIQQPPPPNGIRTPSFWTKVPWYIYLLIALSIIILIILIIVLLS